jgi:hypothetical protein
MPKVKKIKLPKRKPKPIVTGGIPSSIAEVIKGGTYE